MAIRKGQISSGGSTIFPRNSLDNIVKDPVNSTTYIASDGKILSEYMDLQSDVGGASTSSDKAKAPTTSAVQEYVSSSGIIPQSAVNGLDASLSSKQNVMSAGYRMELVGGTTIDQSRYFEIEPAIIASANATTSVTLSAGKAYEINATASNAKVEFHREEPPMQRAFGLEGHMEIFVANTGYIVAGSDVVLAQPLEPDSVNNCTIRFHDGLAIISVEDNIAGYIVSVSSGTLNGSLPYGITSAGSQYIAFNDTLAGIAIDLSGASANGEKHIVGNGYSDTILKGAVDCGTSKFTVANLSLDGVQVNGGVMTLGDVYIPNGATVAVNGGGLAVEKVTGNGGVIDLGGTFATVSSGAVASVGAVTIMDGSNSDNGGALVASRSTLVLSGGSMLDNRTDVTAKYGGAINTFRATVSATNETFIGNRAYLGGVIQVSSTTATFDSCMFSGNFAAYGAVGRVLNGHAIFNSCTVNGNSCTNNGSGTFLYIQEGGSCTLSASDVEDDIYFYNNGTTGGDVNFVGSNHFGGSAWGNHLVANIASGAILDLTGNTNTTPINPGGGIVFESGGATVKVGDSTASSSYMMDNVTLPAGAKLTNTAVVNLGGANVSISPGTTASASGCTITGGSASAAGAAVNCSSAYIALTDCTISGNVAGYGAIACTGSGAVVDLNRCEIYENESGYTKGLYIIYDGRLNVTSSILHGSAANQCYCDRGAVVAFTNTNCNRVEIGSGGSVIFAGMNTIEQVTSNGVGGNITISSGAIVDLTGNTNATPIAPGGGITLYGNSDYVNPTTIIGSAGSETQSRTFAGNCTITGTAITKIGGISGATVTLPSDSCEIDYIKAGESVVSSAYIQASESPYVLETQQGAGAVLVRVSPD